MKIIETKHIINCVCAHCGQKVWVWFIPKRKNYEENAFLDVDVDEIEENINNFHNRNNRNECNHHSCLTDRGYDDEGYQCEYLTQDEWDDINYEIRREDIELGVLQLN